METDQDIRAKALLDQLNEIDQRILCVREGHLNKKIRVLNTGIFGIFVVLLALSVSSLERAGVHLALPAGVLMVAFLGSGPLIRLFQTRKLERERDRVLALYEEIDRRLAPGSVRPGTDANVS